MGKRFAILIGVAATGVMALGAQTASSTTGDPVDSTPPDLQLSGPKKQSPQKTAGAKKGCGTFQFAQPRVDVRVVVNRGKVSCKTAGEVMRKLFRKGPNRTIGKWDCIGPQTGFARCDYGNRRITGHFQKGDR